MKILAVDDDKTIIELLSTALGALGYSGVELANSGAKALEILNNTQQPVDCVLADIQMPEMDGIELVRQIRALPGYSRVPIIMVTAMSDRSYIDRAFAAGASDYVTKPFDILELNTRLELVKKLVHEHQLVVDGASKVEALKEELEGQYLYQVAEPLEFQNMEKALSCQAFENYMLQLGRFSLFQSSVFAVKIEDIEKVHKKSTPCEYRYALRQVAVSILQNLNFGCNFLAYRGNGLFVCIDHNDGLHLGRGIDKNRPAQLDDLHIVRDDGSRIEVTAHIGDPVSLGVFGKSKVSHYLRKAVENVDAKIDRRYAEISPLGKAAPDPAKMQQPYKSLLHDSLSEGLYRDKPLSKSEQSRQPMRSSA